MRRRLLAGVGALVASALLAGCGSGGGATGGGARSSIKVGVLTSLSGGFAPGFTTVEKGVKARLDLANSTGGVNGRKIEYVMADDANGADTAVQKLVQQEKVFGILSVSPSFIRGAAVAARSGLPVIGSGFDGAPQWLDPKVTNFFNIIGAVGYSAVGTTFGDFMKDQGVTRMAAVGNTGGPSSAAAATGAIMSAEHAGIPKAYLNTSLAPGSTDVGPIVLAIKASGADGLFTPVIPTTAFAIVAGLAQAGVKMKAILLATGYGNDLLESKPAVALAQGVNFVAPATPAELRTPATIRFVDALKRFAGVTGTPTFAEYQGWLAADAFIAGLKAAGKNPTPKGFVERFRRGDWDTAGLLGSPSNHILNFGEYGSSARPKGPQSCAYIVKLQGTGFVPQPDASPACGEVIPGLKTGF